MDNNPENYDKLWTITLRNEDYSKIIEYVNVTNFKCDFTGLEMSCICLNEACKPKRVWSACCCHYDKDNPVNNILPFKDICNIDVREQSEVEEVYRPKIILINKEI